MREILFRGKKVSDNEWVYGCLVNNIYGASKPIIITDSDYDDNNCVNFDWDFVTPQTVGQFTGIYDKNGVKIFEGDIVRTDNGHIGYVIFRYGSFVKECSCHYKAFRVYGDNETVIGNIYDNPELLEQGESK